MQLKRIRLAYSRHQTGSQKAKGHPGRVNTRDASFSLESAGRTHPNAAGRDGHAPIGFAPSLFEAGFQVPDYSARGQASAGMTN